ncbi:MAG: transcription elongation factor GreA [Rickettsiaceae bacterium]|nr:transcription elongation factor GreA [Rickettsiaceae bacterium]
MNRFPITAEGYEKMAKEIKELKYVQRPEIIEAISTAREFGDLSENAEYHAAKEKQSFIEGKIADLESKLSHAEIIDSSKLTNESVKFGAYVKILDEETEEENIYQITGEYEADMRNNKISAISPLGKSLIGKAVGDIVEVSTPKGRRSFEILEIDFNAMK